MKEQLLYHIWTFRHFDQLNLETIDGQPVQILQTGRHNTDSGPDFFNAQIQLGEIHWAGNVEIHTRTSDWHRHEHNDDPAFQNIILHVVYEHDTEAAPLDIPVLELKPYVPAALLERYRQLQESLAWIPCQDSIADIDAFTIMETLQKAGTERLIQRSTNILARLEVNNGNWEETMYQILARYYGLKANQDAFELTARQLPYNILAKHHNYPQQVEALLFGVAGFLDEPHSDAYYLQLQKEYRYLAHKYSLKPVKRHSWKFMRMRPASFPTVRLAQFSALLSRTGHLFRNLVEAEGYKSYVKFLQAEPADYWLTHYRFGTGSAKRKKVPGEGFVQLLIINAVAPVLFAYGLFLNDETLKHKAIDLLEHCPPESNAIIKRWAGLGIKPRSAFESQALLQLKTEHCDHKQCLNCTIGHKLLLSGGVKI